MTHHQRAGRVGRLVLVTAALFAVSVSSAVGAGASRFTFKHNGDQVLFFFPVPDGFPSLDGGVYQGEIEIAFPSGASHTATGTLYVSPEQNHFGTPVPAQVVIQFDEPVDPWSAMTLTVTELSIAPDCRQHDVRQLYCGVLPSSGRGVTGSNRPAK